MLIYGIDLVFLINGISSLRIELKLLKYKIPLTHNSSLRMESFDFAKLTRVSFFTNHFRYCVRII